MEVTRLEEGSEGWAELCVRDGIVLAQGILDGEAGYVERVRAFDPAVREPLGPALHVRGAACLAPRTGPRSAPAVVHAMPGALVLSDPRTGSPLRRVPLQGRERWSGDPTGLAAGTLGGRPTVFVLDEEPWNEHEWWAVDLGTGVPVPGLGDAFHAHHMVREKMALAGEYLVAPVQRVRLDDFLMDEVEDRFQSVYRLSDGRRIAEIECERGEEAVAAVVGGRPLMAVEGRVHALPDLDPVVELGSARNRTVRALAEWAGLPVLVFTEEEGGYFPAGDRPFRLFFRFLDRSDRPTTEISWTGAAGVYDVVAATDGTVAVSTSKGLYVLRVDL